MDVMKSFSLEGKVALVTGGAYGIGFAIAEAYAAAGATIVFNDINQELVDRGLKAYAEKGIRAKGYVCDVTDEEAVQAFIEGRLSFGKIADVVMEAMEKVPVFDDITVDVLSFVDSEARRITNDIIGA